MDNSTNRSAFSLTGSWYLPADVPNLMVLTLIAVLGLGNLGVILSFVQTKALRKPFNFIVLAMAVGNFAMSDVSTPMEIVVVLWKFAPAGSTFCNILVFFKIFSFSQSMLFISLVAVLRVSGGLSKHYVGLSLKKVIVCVVAVYVISLAWTGMWLLPQWNNINVCMGVQGSASRLPVMILFTVTGALFIITMCSYLILYISLRCKKAQAVILAGQKKSEILTLKAAVTVSIIFLICYLIPFIPAVFPPSVRLFPGILHVVHIFNSLACLQSALNPYVYLATNSRFRRVYWKSWRRVVRILRCRRGEVSPINVTSNTPATPATPASPHQPPAGQIASNQLVVHHVSAPN